MNNTATPSNEKGKEKDINRNKIILVSMLIIGLLLVVIFLVTRIIDAKRAQQQARNFNPFTENINFTPAAQGGTITFTPNGGEYNKPVKVQLNFEPLKSSRGDDIEADIYYTNNGDEPTRNTMPYFPGQVINIVGEEELTIKARLIARMGKYAGPINSQSYTIKPVVIDQTQTETKKSQETGPGETTEELQTGFSNSGLSNAAITDFSILDPTTQEDILKKTERILIKAGGIESLKGGVINMQIFISQIGTPQFLAITGLEVEPKEKIAVIRSQLEKRIKEVKFSPPLMNGNAVDANIRIEFKNFGVYDEQLIFER